MAGTKVSTDELKRIQGLLEDDKITEDNALDELIGAVEEYDKDGVPDAEVLKTALSRVTELETRLSTIEPKMDADIVEEIADSVETLLSALVPEHIAPAVRDDLQKILIGEPDHRNLTMLSRKAAGNGKTNLARQIIAALAKNTIVEMAEKSGHQVTKLSRATPGDEDKTDEAAGAAMVELAYGKPAK